jgi:hypothetical protein
MTEMTVLELLLDYLPSDYVDCIVNNLEDRKVLEDDAYSIEGEMMALFDWSASKEGYDFWNQVFHYVLGNSELPPLPIVIDYKPSSVIYADDVIYVMNVGSTNINIKMNVDLKELNKATNQKSKAEVYSWLN